MSGRPLLLRAYPMAQPWYIQVVGNADAAECGGHVAGCGGIRRANARVGIHDARLASVSTHASAA